MTKHSPAPFGAYATPSSDPYNIRLISDADGNDIATIRYPAGMSQEEALANAALFKAAPLLLDALKVMIAMHPPLHNNPLVDMERRREIARAAIALAEPTDD